jgi:transcriptional regulator with GAF, ATPase, and Fis domain
LDRHNRLLLSVWREACRHIEIADMLDRIAPLLTRELAVSTILIRQFAVERSCVETVASTSAGLQFDRRIELRTECSSRQIDELLNWVNLPHARHATAAALRRELPGLLPANMTGEVLIGPLKSEHGHFGAIVVISDQSGLIQPEHVELLSLLLEPFTVALENDRRLHELVTLRERAEAENRSLLTKLGRTDAGEVVVGAQTGLRKVMERVGQVAKSDVPILILGETGSGKEVIARAIHRQSRREHGPFLRVNCGAIPSELIDSELFGHEKGSFTGAFGQRKGWFERADGGTLFLDECGELPLAAQVRLLRVLQDGSFERVGGDRTLHVDVRIVAATHRDLKAMVADKTFREDLWYRLAVFPIDLPALRQRPQDIPEMARHFAARAAHKLGLRPCVPDESQIAMLVAYVWPGNVRELASVMERAAILGEGTHLDVAMALGSAGSAPSSESPSQPQRRSSEAVVTRFPSLDDAMASHIESALLHAKGRIEGPHGAARLLGINPHTLRARMRKLSIDWQRFRPESR